jgi:hypothetical protein
MASSRVRATGCAESSPCVTLPWNGEAFCAASAPANKPAHKTARASRRAGAQKRIELVLEEFGDIKVVLLSTKGCKAEKLRSYKDAKNGEKASY